MRGRTVRNARAISVVLAIAGCEPAITLGGRADAAVDGSQDGGTPCTTALVASQVAVGEQHVCALSDGIVRCWGDGQAGQLCAGTNVVSSTVPVQVYSPDTFVEVEAGALLTCMRRADGTVFCCGNDDGGGLANGTEGSSAYPVETTSGAVDVTIGVANVYTRRAADLLTVWGDNSYGQLGLGPSTVGTAVETETDVAGSSFPVIAASTNHACAIDGANHLFCTGSNEQSRLGITGGDRDVFTQVSASLMFSSVGPGYRNSCAVTTGGALYCWGSNDPEVVTTFTGTVDFPARVGTDSDFVSIDMGFDHGCVLKTGQRLFCFGDNSHGELGFSGAGAWPLTEVTPGVAYSSVVAGRDLTCAIRASDSVVICFGDPEFGLLGHPSNDPAPSPVCLVP